LVLNLQWKDEYNRGDAKARQPFYQWEMKRFNFDEGKISLCSSFKSWEANCFKKIFSHDTV